MSNILAMPLVQLQVETSNNEDWIDSIVYYVDTGEISLPQLDIRGIVFEMEIRRSALEHEVVLSASTANGTLKIGVPPDVGYFLFNIPVTQMQNIIAGTYVGDITGRDAIYTRQIARVTLNIVEGVTKQPVVMVGTE
jgi:hypothetical protein